MITPDFQVIATSLSLVVLRMYRAEWTAEEANLNNQQLHDRLAARHDVFVTQTWLHSRRQDIFCIRIALGGQHTTMNDVEAVWAIIAQVAGDLGV